MGPDLSGGLESLARLELPSSTGSSFSPGGEFNPNPSHFSPTSHRSAHLYPALVFTFKSFKATSLRATSRLLVKNFPPEVSLQSSHKQVSHSSWTTMIFHPPSPRRGDDMISDRSEKRGWSDSLVAGSPDGTPCHRLPVLPGGSTLIAPSSSSYISTSTSYQH